MENNSVKRKFNIFDALIILILVAAVAGILFLAARANSNVKTYKVNYKIEVTDVDALIKDSATVGDGIRNAVQQTDIGVINGVEVSPYKQELMDYKTGQKVMAEVPNRYTITLQCSSKDATVQNGRVMVNGTLMGVGVNVFFQSKDFAGSGVITVLNVTEDTNTNKGV